MIKRKRSKITRNIPEIHYLRPKSMFRPIHLKKICLEKFISLQMSFALIKVNGINNSISF